MRQIDIQFPIGNAGPKTFPVFYAVENREEECMQIFRCTVGLPQTQFPGSLLPAQFELVTHVRDGMQMVDYNASTQGVPHTPEADCFRYKVYTEIFFHELRKRNDSFAKC